MKLTAAALGILLAGVLSGASGGEGRIGYSEDFDTMRGWRSGADCRMSSDKGLGIFHTSVGSWTKSFKWTDPPYDKISGGGTWAGKTLGRIDLDRYHYIVARVVEKGCVCRTHFCGKEIEVTHTTGIIAQDLAPLGVTGTRDAKISFELGNNNTAVKIDYIRLVSELTAEESKGLLPNPIAIKAEGVERVPYDGLEALNARAARPAIAEAYEEKCAFIDLGTGTRKWKMTDSDGHENFSERSGSIWTPDGSAFYAEGRPGGRAYHYYAKDAWEPGKVLPGGSRYSYYWKWLRELYKPSPVKGKSGFKTFAILRVDSETGREDEIARIETWEPWEFTEWRDQGNGILVFALRESHTGWVIHADEPDPKKRVREIRLPSRLKGFSYDHDNQRVSWHTCYTYERNVMDLKTGALSRGAQHKFGHGPSGKLFGYGSVTKSGKGMVYHGADHTPGDMVKIAGIYATPLSIDYGSVSADNAWIFSNGMRGEVGKQHVMVNLADGGTILRMATYWTSYAGWDRSTRGGASTDSTKYVYISDMLGDGDYYFAIIRNPDPPRNLEAARRGGSVTLEWKRPARCAEAKGYNVYRSEESGRNFARINREPVTERTYTDPAAPTPAFYLVAMEEHSGLEGHFSNEASADYGRARSVTLHFDAVCCEKTPPMREVLGNVPPYHRYLRVTKVMDGEETGKLTVDADIPKAGEYTVWGRVWNNANKGGTFLVDDVGLKVGGSGWHWSRAEKPLRLRPGRQSIVISSGTEDDCVERITLTTSKEYKPVGPDERKRRGPKSAARRITRVEKGPNHIRFEWEPGSDLDFDHWRVYVTDKIIDWHFNNATVLQSGRKNFCLDWGLKPGTAYHYGIVAYDKRGNASGYMTISETTDPLAVVTKEVAPKGLTPGEAGGVKYVSGEGDVAYDFDLEKAGGCYLWLKYNPRHPRGTRLKVSLAGRSGDFSVKAPGRLGRQAKNDTWYLDRLKVGSPVHRIDLPAGTHALRVTLPKDGPRVSTLYVTNDASYTPPGFDVRAELKKR